MGRRQDADACPSNASPPDHPPAGPCPPARAPVRCDPVPRVRAPPREPASFSVPSGGCETGARQRWHQPAPAPHITMFRDGIPEQRHRAPIRVREPQQDPDRRGLPGTVRTEITERATARDEKLHLIHRDVLPEPLRQPVRLNRPAAISRSVVRNVTERGRAHRTHGPTASTDTDPSSIGDLSTCASRVQPPPSLSIPPSGTSRTQPEKPRTASR